MGKCDQMQKAEWPAPSSSSTARMRAVALRMLARLTTVVWVSLATLHARGSRREEPLMASPRAGDRWPAGPVTSAAFRPSVR
jgi:hypothetical protein